MLPPPTSAENRPSAARAWPRLARSQSARIGAALLLMFSVTAILADYVAPYAPNHTSTEVAEPPTPRHWLGTDALRKDVLSRVIHGSRLSLLAGVVSISLAVLIGTPVGSIAGYFGGSVDALLMRGVDVALAFPSILIALLVAAAFRPGWITVVLAVGLINVPVFARQVRATVLTVAHLDYVVASRAMGAGNWHLLTRVIMPALVSPVIVLASLSLGTAILEVAGLSFLGLGGDPTAAEWGAMLAQAKDYWGKNVWFAIAPGMAISLTVLGFNLLGDGVRDALDPRLDSPFDATA